MSFDCPDSKWFPLHEGILRFLGETWLSELCTGISRASIVIEYDPDSLTFFLALNRTGETEEISVGSFRIGDSELKKATPRGNLKEVESLLIDRAVGWVAEALEHALHFRHGKLFNVYARMASPLTTEFSAVPPDVFQHFAVTEWRRGIALAEATGERLFSIHLGSAEGQEQAASTPAKGKVPAIARFLKEKYGSKRPSSRTLDQLKSEFLAWNGDGPKTSAPDSKTMNKGFRLAERLALEESGNLAEVPRNPELPQ